MLLYIYLYIVLCVRVLLYVCALPLTGESRAVRLVYTNVEPLDYCISRVLIFYDVSNDLVLPDKYVSSYSYARVLILL